MLAIFAYAIGIMYTPGPINLLGLHSGLNKRTYSHLGFFIGVGCAMFILFVFLGYLGRQVVNTRILPFISVIGCSYILYIAWKIIRSNFCLDETNTLKNESSLSFRDGLFMQLLNPKGLIATLPIATIQFPNAGISGISIIFWSLILAILAFGAPTCYSLVGLAVGKRIDNPAYFKAFNYMMSALLIYVSLTIGYQHVYLPLID